MRIMTPLERATMATDARIQEVIQAAKGYQAQVPGLAWTEALRLAEKHIPHRSI
jgi:hypothetical protein